MLKHAKLNVDKCNYESGLVKLYCSHMYAGYFVKISRDVKCPNVTSKSKLVEIIYTITSELNG